MRRHIKWMLIVTTLAGLFCLVASYLLWTLWSREISTPYRGYLSEELIFDVPKGMGVREIAHRLEDSGVIKSAELLQLYLRLYGPENLIAGVYRFKEPQSLRQVAEILANGQTIQLRFTVPEGTDLTGLAALGTERGFGTIDGFLEATRDVSLIADLDPEARDLEGYLFPDTYFLSARTDEREIVRRMVNNFRQFWNEGRQDQAVALGMTTRDLVTLASLVEKETGVPSERPLVSAVFHNRLRLGMKLMCDPTVVYGVRLVKDYDGIIHRSDLALDSPYNTYLYYGLPQGPIANPGREALEAALAPAPVEYLYFVSRNDGTHLFSRDYRSHQRAVERFQR